MSTSWFEIIVILIALACVYVSYRLCNEGYGLLRLARLRYERRIARMLIVLGYMLGALIVLAGVCIASQWF